MVAKDWAKAEAFIDYAWDAEGMEFVAVAVAKTGSYKLIPKTGVKYDPACVRAVWRNFQQEWKLWV